MMEIDLPRPRSFGNVTDPDFIELKTRLLTLLHQESPQMSVG